MKQQFRRLWRKPAATYGLGYCLKGFADISCYYMINHKIGHSGNTLVCIVTFIRIAARFVLFSSQLRFESFTNSHIQLLSSGPKESQCWQIWNEWLLILMLYEVASLCGVNYKLSHIILQGEKKKHNKNFCCSEGRNCFIYWGKKD